MSMRADLFDTFARRVKSGDLTGQLAADILFDIFIDLEWDDAFESRDEVAAELNHWMKTV